MTTIPAIHTTPKITRQFATSTMNPPMAGATIGATTITMVRRAITFAAPCWSVMIARNRTRDHHAGRATRSLNDPCHNQCFDVVREDANKLPTMKDTKTQRAESGGGRIDPIAGHRSRLRPQLRSSTRSTSTERCRSIRRTSSEWRATPAKRSALRRAGCGDGGENGDEPKRRRAAGGSIVSSDRG